MLNTTYNFFWSIIPQAGGGVGGGRDCFSLLSLPLTKKKDNENKENIFITVQTPVVLKFQSVQGSLGDLVTSIFSIRSPVATMTALLARSQLMPWTTMEQQRGGEYILCSSVLPQGSHSENISSKHSPSSLFFFLTSTEKIP